ncbi:ATP-binding protein [Lyngbya sp. CCY1209]|uniref:hybrid sensor histidine kinase/response regulator n=1 Tax=Lyngbya sp. CCY1209 TaxID=2886103 RepID=UPI002D2004C3|nr:ATP-binding protein [Lyngbya sp. CCY1209]MEB3886103.1 response regulator [Lyngbya sp. CCY1209]
MSEISILIVEDELLIAKGLARKLKKLGYGVADIVSSGDKALEAVEANKPDLVLMDIVIKGDMDGIETATKIHEKYGTPVIYVTAYADDSTLERAEFTGSYGYILKPFKDREVHATIRMAMRKYQEQMKVKQSLDLAEASREEKSRLLSIASHDLRTPLTSIQMSADLLETHESKLTYEKKLKHFQRIQAAVKNMNELLEDVLTLSRSESGKLNFNPVPLNAIEFCEKLIEEFRVQLDGKHDLEFKSWGATDGPVVLDAKLLRHAFENLLSNAIKYSPDGGTINFYVIRKADRIIFRIKDCGIGFPPEYKDKLFQAFERASNVGQIKGTGLGLSIVKQVVDLHRGEIAVESELGKGTTFTVTLPLTSEG